MKLWNTFILALSAVAYGTSGPTIENAAPTVQYREGKKIELDATLIQTSVQRPELAIVTGDERQGDSGLLRLRDNFNDRIAADAAADLP